MASDVLSAAASISFTLGALSTMSKNFGFHSEEDVESVITTSSRCKESSKRVCAYGCLARNTCRAKKDIHARGNKLYRRSGSHTVPRIIHTTPTFRCSLRARPGLFTTFIAKASGLDKLPAHCNSTAHPLSRSSYDQRQESQEWTLSSFSQES